MRETLGCPILTRYTSTEAGVTTSTRVDDPDEVVANTVGRPAPEVELRIASPGDGRTLGVNEVGEVVTRSPAMMNGYWRDPALTASVVDGEGWLHTGDLGTVRDDGNLCIVGRVKEMYIRAGYNVYPAEVEAVLSKHPSVDRAAVVGAPDPMLGEVGVAFLVPTTGRDAAATLSPDDVRAWCRAHIADYKAPDRIVIVDDLPVTAMLKIDKAALSALAAERPQGVEHAERTERMK
jgi:acyl-CoA synthetase (AMP-forming)/AMP-acid ligase II